MTPDRARKLANRWLVASLSVTAGATVVGPVFGRWDLAVIVVFVGGISTIPRICYWQGWENGHKAATTAQVSR